MASTEQIEQRALSLVSLPPEIRNKIYQEIIGGKNRVVRLSSKPVEQPALSQTCRLIRNEMLPMFYGDCVFEAGNPWHVFRFLKPLGQQSLGLLRDVRMSNPFQGKAGLQQARANLSYLNNDYGKRLLPEGAAKVALLVGCGEDTLKETVWVSTARDLDQFTIHKRIVRNGRYEGFIVKSGSQDVSGT